MSLTLQQTSQIASIAGDVGSVITGLGTLSILYLSLRVNKRSLLWAKQSRSSDILRECSTRFIQIYEMRNNPDTPSNPVTYYRLFWALQYDQYIYWQQGVIDNGVFDHWMECRKEDWRINEYVGRVSYRRGFEIVRNQLKHDDFWGKMDNIHRLAEQEQNNRNAERIPERP